MKFYYKTERQTANSHISTSALFLLRSFCRHQFVLSLYSLDEGFFLKKRALIWGILTVSGDTKLIVSIVRQHLKLPFVEIKSTAAELWVLRHLIWATVTIIYMLSIRNNNGFLWHVIGPVDQFEDWEEQCTSQCVDTPNTTTRLWFPSLQPAPFLNERNLRFSAME